MKILTILCGLALSCLSGFAQQDLSLRQSQARDLRELIMARSEIAKNQSMGVFILDARELNKTSNKTSAHAIFSWSGSVKLSDVIEKYKKQFADNFYFSKQSSIVVFSQGLVVRFDLIKGEEALGNVIIAPGDIVFLGNYGDYL
jgi:hypothetical protein